MNPHRVGLASVRSRTGAAEAVSRSSRAASGLGEGFQPVREAKVRSVLAGSRLRLCRHLHDGEGLVAKKCAAGRTPATGVGRLQDTIAAGVLDVDRMPMKAPPLH